MTDTYNKVAGALDESRALLAEVMAELTAAAERERVLREALEKYGAHQPTCIRSALPIMFDEQHCTCGWDEARAALEVK